MDARVRVQELCGASRHWIEFHSGEQYSFWGLGEQSAIPA